MSSHGTGQFVVENVPHRCDLESAVIEFAALKRGLGVQRESRAMLFLHLPSATVPFVGLHGPDSSSVGRWLCRHPNGLQALAAYHGLGGPHFSEDVVGDHVRLFVLDGNVVSATMLRGANDIGADRKRVADLIVKLQAGPIDGIDIVDVTDTVDPSVTELAVAALAMIPRLPYAEVEIITPTAGEAAIAAVHYNALPLAHFPTHGQPRELAGAIIDHYLSNPGWEAARQQPSAVGRESV